MPTRRNQNQELSSASRAAGSSTPSMGAANGTVTTNAEQSEESTGIEPANEIETADPNAANHSGTGGKRKSAGEEGSKGNAKKTATATKKRKKKKQDHEDDGINKSASEDSEDGSAVGSNQGTGDDEDCYSDEESEIGEDDEGEEDEETTSKSRDPDNCLSGDEEIDDFNDTDGVIPEEEPNNFEVIGFIKEDQQATQLIVDADTSAQKISLLSMSLFVHETENLLMCE